MGRRGGEVCGLRSPLLTSVYPPTLTQAFNAQVWMVHSSEPGGGTGAGVARRGGRVLEPLLGAVVGTGGRA